MQSIMTGKSNVATNRIVILVTLFLLLTSIAFGLPGDKLPLSETKTNIESSRLLQYTINDHTLGFAQDKVYLAGLDHALTVEFINGNQTQPQRANKTTSLFEKVTYFGVWQGIDVIYTPVEDGIAESTYQLAPSANVNDIILRYNLPVELLENGQLRFQFQSGYILEDAPIAWQVINGERHGVDVRFMVINRNEIGFSLGDYDPAHLLTIDPEYSWHSFYGGINSDYSSDITVDANGDILITGSANSAIWTLPGNPAPINSHKSGFDIFVLKLDKSGGYKWHTFLGSTWDDQGINITTDPDNNIVIIGKSSVHWNGPGNTSPINNFTSTNDLVVAKLDNNGNYLWHTFYPGISYSNDPDLKGIVTDPTGNIYITSPSNSWSGPGNTPPLHPATPNDYGSEIVIIKLKDNGIYQWHTYFGSLGDDHGKALAIDNTGNLFITGKSSRTWNGPGNIPPVHTYDGSAFTNTVIIKISNMGDYQWHTFYGHPTGDDYGNAIDVDANGFLYVSSPSGPDGLALNNTLGGSLLIKLNSITGDSVWHSRVGGGATAIHTTQNGDTLVGGASYSSTNGPNGEQPLNPWSGGEEIFLLAIDTNGSYQWHTYYGSNDALTDYLTGLTMDANGNIYAAANNSQEWNGPNGSTPINPFTSAGPNISNPDFAVIKMGAQNPNNIILDNSNINENLPSETVIGTLTTIDPDSSAPFTYMLVPGQGDTDNSAFVLNGNQLLNKYPFNFLTKNSYSIRVRASDNGGLYFEKAFTISVNDLPPVFSDVPDSHWAAAWIERLYNSGITGGCANTPLAYCPESTVTRAQMAIFLEKGMHGSLFTPANVSPSFTDTENHWAEDWIEALKSDGVTSGCGEGILCPENSVTRAQMAVFLLKAKHGASFSPPPASGTFSDVPTDYWAAAWIEQLASEGITSGCGGSNYCPENPVTRAQMAIFLVKAFSLP